jgi:hypothetical protein
MRMPSRQVAIRLAATWPITAPTLLDRTKAIQDIWKPTEARRLTRIRPGAPFLFKVSRCRNWTRRAGYRGTLPGQAADIGPGPSPVSNSSGCGKLLSHSPARRGSPADACWSIIFHPPLFIAQHPVRPIAGSPLTRARGFINGLQTGAALAIGIWVGPGHDLLQNFLRPVVLLFAGFGLHAVIFAKEECCGGRDAKWLLCQR